MTKDMTLDEFRKYTEENDYNIVESWDLEHFKIKCSKCKSEDILVFFRTESGRMGSEWTGYMRGFNHDEGMIIKCKSCGNAMDLRLPI